MKKANGMTTCLVVAAGSSASQEDGAGPGICLGDGQSDAPGVSAGSGRSVALLRCMLPYMTWRAEKIGARIEERPYKTKAHELSAI